MRLETNSDNTSYAIRAYDDEGITVNDEKFTHSFIISPDKLIPHWRPIKFTELTIDDVAEVLNLRQEILILGCGKHSVLPDQSIIDAIRKKEIGFEIMDTYAACRCYSILISEGRSVAAGLIIDQE
ncbi:MAG: Mth938-like domain-containing protein [Gammaproteobacteria bacterium]